MNKIKTAGIIWVGWILFSIPFLYFMYTLIIYMRLKDLPLLISSIGNPAGYLLITQMVAGIGILRHKSWAIKLTKWVGIFYLIGGICFLILSFIGKPSSGFILLIIFCISFGIFLNIYLTRPEVKEQFK